MAWHIEEDDKEGRIFHLIFGGGALQEEEDVTLLKVKVGMKLCV